MKFTKLVCKNMFLNLLKVINGNMFIVSKKLGCTNLTKIPWDLISLNWAKLLVRVVQTHTHTFYLF